MKHTYRTPVNLMTERVRVLVLGAGGTGSHLVSRELVQLDTTLRQLGNKGLDVTIADGGIVSEANLSRQHFLPTQVGSNKAEAQVFITNNLYGRDFKAINKNLDAREINYANYDILITAVDRPSTRLAIHQQRSIHQKLLWLDCGNDSKMGNVVLGELTRNPKLPSICDLYDYSKLSDTDAEIKSCSSEESIGRQTLGVNATAARLAGQLLWNVIHNGETDVHGAFFDTATLESFPIHCDDETWAIYGWQQTTAA